MMQDIERQKVDEKQQQQSTGGAASKPATADGKPYRIKLEIVGHAFGRLNQRGKRTQVVGLLYLRNQPDVATVRDLVTERLCSIPKMRCKLVLADRFYKSSYWEETEMDMDYHFRVAFEDRDDVTSDDIHNFMSNLYQDHLDLDKPLWCVIFIPCMADGRSALVFNINHAIGDGIAQIELLFHLLDKESPGGDPAGAVTAQGLTMGGESTAAKLRITKRKPQKASLWDRARMFVYGSVEGAVRAFMPRDPMNLLRLQKPTTQLSKNKMMGDAVPIDLERVQAIKNKFEGASVNDVLLTMVTLTVKSVLEEGNDPIAKTNKLSGNFPINMRKRGESGFRDGNPWNKVSYGKFTMPFKAKSRIEAVWKCKRQADLQKLSPAPYSMIAGLGLLLKTLPVNVALPRALSLSAQSTSQISNVVGPQHEVSIGGNVIDNMTFYLFGPIGMYYGVLTYAGKLNMSINMDTQVPVRPEKICEHWQREFEALEAEVNAHEGKIPRPPNTCFGW